MAIDKLLKYRSWHLHFSFLKRKCYISGQPLRFTWAYRGRRKVWYPVLGGGNCLYDDIWLSQSEYLTFLSKGIV